MTLTFFFEKNSYFSGVMLSCINICIFGTKLLVLKNKTVTSLEHNCHIFGMQRAGYVERSLMTTLWLFYLQYCAHSNLMMRQEQLSLSLECKFIKTENGGNIGGLLGEIQVTLLWLLRTPFKYNENFGSRNFFKFDLQMILTKSYVTFSLSCPQYCTKFHGVVFWWPSLSV